MNVRHDRLREIKVQHAVDALKVNAARHQVGTNQHPNFAQPKVLDDVVTLRLRPVGVNHIDVDAVVPGQRKPGQKTQLKPTPK